MHGSYKSSENILAIFAEFMINFTWLKVKSIKDVS